MWKIEWQRPQFFFLKTLAKVSKVATSKHRAMMTDHYRKSSELGSEGIGRHMIEGKLVKVYCINFKAALMLSGGKQRAQIYAELLVPDLHDFEPAVVEYNTFLKLQTVREKTGRSIHTPNVLFSSKKVLLLKLYLEEICPVVIASTGSNEAGTRYKRLLLDTRDGSGLTSSQIRRTFRAFITRVDSNLSSVTPTALQGSYVTWMLQKYKAGKTFSWRNESDFLGTLAKQ